MSKFQCDAYDTDPIRLAVAKICGAKIGEKHIFEGRDDNRWFECRICGASFSWGNYVKNNKKYPPTPCYGSDDNYTENQNAIIDAVNSKVPDDLMRTYIDFLVDEMLEGEYTVNASANQRARALVKFKEKYP